MPTATLRPNQGNQSVIPANASRGLLIVQNNGSSDARIRFYGAVSLTDTSKAGLLLRAHGGSIVISGAAAQQAVYALSASPDNQELVYESDL